ncbi:hypothetical protein GJ744_000330 [Endocarpon pusillum]|uniref:Uncharacterized protein n=1 Tax=Endocarpon pusillum TaxID=364733 RepID=A0A8H7APC3_9EURO|nr:hypothetical protein GJ744_000330 [Endocarpon pusillum]
MCFRACGCWPFHDTYLEPGPPQDTYIIVDDNAQFYPDPGITHPAPVYYANQPQAQAPMGYYMNQATNQYIPHASTAHAPAGYHYPSQVATGAQYPGYPYPAQASGSTTLPDGTTLFLGKTKEQVMWENQQIANNTGANDPIQMVPYNAAPGQQFWCRELDGSWTLRTVQETMVELQPGYWDKGQSGHAVFIRQKP